MSHKSWKAAIIPALLVGALAQAQDASCPVPAPQLDGYFIVTHPDARACPSPMCGGYFVKQVNKPRTRCADGSWQVECHAALIDDAALKWPDDQRARFLEALGQGKALVRGALYARSEATNLVVDVLAIDEAWRGQAGSAPLGAFHQLVNNGIVCITTPCASFDARKLNSIDAPRQVSGVNLAASGATDEQIAAGRRAMRAPPGILAAGHFRPVTENGTETLRYVASEFYRRVAVAGSGEGQACGNGASCRTGLFCDLASCDAGSTGICRTRPDACPQVYDPVCGCDGVTYANDCARQQSGVPLGQPGACPRS